VSDAAETESPEKEAESPAGGEKSVARTAGRGGLAIAFAKAYFILMGLVQQTILPRVLGLDGYGALSSVLSASSIAYNPIVSTSIQGVSRAVASAPDAEQPQAMRKALSIHAVVVLPFALLFLLAAGPLGRAMGAPHLILALRIVSGVLLFYGLYTPLVGVLNGTQRFVWQAGLDILAATVRTIALIGGAVLLASRLGGVVGSTIGFVCASLVVFGAALFKVGIGKAGPTRVSVRAHLGFIAPLFLGQILLNLLLQADLTLLRRFAFESAKAASLPATAADPFVGAYRATQLFSFLPYQFLLAITFILFPMLARAHRDGDREAVARYVRNGVRLALVLAGAMVSVTSGLAGPLLRLVFPPQAAVLGTQSMQLLTLGFGAFALFGILTTVLNSLQQERASTIVTGVAFSLVVVLCFLRARGTALSPEILWRTASATTAGIAVATLAAAVVVKRTAGAVVSPVSLIRVVAATGVAIAVARFLPAPGKVMTVAYAAIVGVVYVVVLLVSRELGKDDVENVRAIVSRRR